MTSSHRIKVEIACPACGSSGTIIVVEDAGPPFDDEPRRSYENNSDKFRVSGGTPPTIRCVACGTNFQGRF
jgi:hypothetical protein